MLRPAFPNVPGAGKTNADVLNHLSGEGLLSVGLPATFGRSFAPNPSIDLPVPLLSISERSATVNGRPVCKVTIPKVSQPVSTVDSNPGFEKYWRPLPKGNKYE